MRIEDSMKKILLAAGCWLLATTATLAQTQPEPWDGSISGSFKKEGKTIFIDCPADLAALHNLWNSYKDGDQGYKGWTIKLRADLDMNNRNFNDYTIGWNDDNKFGGTFDGQGHIIQNLKIEGNDNNRGLFGKIDGGTVKNLKLVNVDIHCGDDDDCHIGAICGRMYNHSTISHCAVVGGSVRQYENGNDEFGAICGYMTNNNNKVEYCYSDITVEADAQVGGLVGKIEQGDDHTSGIYHSYFSGTVIRHGDDYFGAICGERYGQPMQNNFFLDRGDGVRATGNQSKYEGSSYHPDGEIKACTEEELKQPLLFRNYNAGYTLESDEYVYPFDGYPELKVFLRYDVGDSFYVTNAGHMGENTADSIPGYVKIEKNSSSPFTVTLEKAGTATANTDFVINDTFTPYFNYQQQLKTVGLGSNVFENLGVVNTVTIPAAVDSVGLPQRHQVQEAFILNGNASEGAVKDNVLYSLRTRYLLTAPKSLTTMTIHQELADDIADYAFENMTDLKTLYVDTYTPAGTLVDDKDNRAPTMTIHGDKSTVFGGCPNDLDVYIKDGTSNQLIFGQQGPKGYGYINASIWNEFYSDYQDVESHMYSYFPVSRNAGHMSTLILGYPVELPVGVTAWWAQAVSSEKVTMKKIGTQIVPALTPVLLTYGGTGPLYLLRYDGNNSGAATDFEGNLFKGSVDPGGHTMTDSEMQSNFLTLGRPKTEDTYEHLGFYLYHPKSHVLPSYIAWIAVSDVPNNARVIEFDESETTGIDLTTAPSLREGAVYDLQGRKIESGKLSNGQLPKGLYVMNGKLVIIR